MKHKLIGSLNGMGLGLLATLVVGTIMGQLGTLLDWSILSEIGGFAKVLMAAAIGIGVAHALDAKPLVMFACIVTATIGAGAIHLSDGQMVLSIGEPAGAYVAAVCTTLIGNFIYGKTKIDILLVPMICLVIGGMVGMFISPTMSEMTRLIGVAINEATNLKPLYMGAIISALMCLVILSPISSAALAISLGLDGLAGGAAVVGCASSMVGFAVISFSANGFSGLVSQAIGTSKIQFGNAVKNPYIVIPTLIASLCGGMLSTTLFQIECNSLGAGMGSSGLVGQIQTISVMGAQVIPSLIILHFVIPAVVSLIVSNVLHQKGFIESQDLYLSLN